MWARYWALLEAANHIKSSDWSPTDELQHAAGFALGLELEQQAKVIKEEIVKLRLARR